jgi:hypothetical protein
MSRDCTIRFAFILQNICLECIALLERCLSAFLSPICDESTSQRLTSLTSIYWKDDHLRADVGVVAQSGQT